jgi:hypothetical protein
MRYVCSLSKEEREEARQWKIEKCGYDSHEKIVELFGEVVGDGKD